MSEAKKDRVLPEAIAAEHARQEAEAGEPVSRADVVVGLVWSGLLREAERRVREKEEQLAALCAAQPEAKKRSASWSASQGFLLEQYGATVSEDGLLVTWPDGTTYPRPGA